jgi:hypothetical protein
MSDGNSDEAATIQYRAAGHNGRREVHGAAIVLNDSEGSLRIAVASQGAVADVDSASDGKDGSATTGITMPSQPKLIQKEGVAGSPGGPA